MHSGWVALHYAAMKKDNAATALLRRIPSVASLLQQTAIEQLCDEYPRPRVKAAIASVLDEYRDAIRDGTGGEFDLREFTLDVRESLRRSERRLLRRVINATGIVLHTGLGRAPLPQQAIDAIIDTASGYCNLELDLETGKRGNRLAIVRDLICEITGAEDALIVSNNAAATFLTLHTLTAGRETIISRGELVEIGGSYRMPDIMSAAGCKMVEVGTTNRTHLYDYERAISPDTAAIIRVHPSNYVVTGFVTRPDFADLAELVAETNEARGLREDDEAEENETATDEAASDAIPLYLIDDLGSGLLDSGLIEIESANEDEDEDEEDDDDELEEELEDEDSEEEYEDEEEEEAEDEEEAEEDDDVDNEFARLTAPAAPQLDEPTVAASLAAGADVVLFSADKLLGGPQAGIILGSEELITRIRKSTLMRTFRPGKLTLAALEATLQLYRDPTTVAEHVPTLRLLSRPLEDIGATADSLETAIAAQAQDRVSIETTEDHTRAGGGSLPDLSLPTWTVCVTPENVTASDVAAELRDRDVPIVCRVQHDALIFDCRTITESEIDEIAIAIGEEV